MNTFDELVSLEEKNERLERLREWAKLVADRFDPHKIILFGSYAYGTPTGHSDADVLVVLDTETAPAEQAVAIRTAIRPPFAMDCWCEIPS